MFVRFSNFTMKRTLFILTTSLVSAMMIFALLPIHRTSASNTSQPASVVDDRALCLPAQLEQFDSPDCTDLGPSGRLKELAQQGITFPAEPLPISKPGGGLANIPFAYALVSNEAVPVYDNLENALADIPGNMLKASKIKYVSLYQKTNTEKGWFYQIATNEWISAQYITKVSIPSFQGYVFKSNPTTPFGWAKDVFTTRNAPSSIAPETGRVYYKYNLLHIYDTRVVNDTEWVMVGVDEWIQSIFLSRVLPNYSNPQGVTGNRWIEINLQEQILLVYDSGKLVFATLISSGSPPFYTQPGVFQILQDAGK